MAEIVASIQLRDAAETIRLARRAAQAGADWLELRLDSWPVEAPLEGLFAALPLPAIVTARLPRDGGTFSGTLAERRRLLEHALAAGAQGLDLEDWETWEPEPKELRLEIRSHHNLTGVTPDLPQLRDRLLRRRGTLAKVVVTAHELADAAPVLDLLAAADQRTEPTVAFALGGSAWPTRILSALLGAPLVYGCIEEGEATAPGQPPIAMLAGLYDVHERSRATQVFGLLGNPALHSLGPWLHNRALRRLGVDGVYLPFESARPEAIVHMLPRRRLRGLSVTAPFKQSLVPLCHRLDAAATAAGAVNTLTFAAGSVVVGHNTDVVGVRRALELAGHAPSRRPAAVLGSGGSARAAALALRDLGHPVTVFARSLDGAREFARRERVTLAGLRADLLRDLDPQVVVHCTPLGGPGHEGERILPAWKPRSGCVVLDLVYRPRTTRLLAEAAAAGATPVSGLWAFVAQAAAQIELFTGERLDEQELMRFLAGV
jgi:shikimate dehydrogenase/3-dehydroquinate dehydratase type I